MIKTYVYGSLLSLFLIANSSFAEEGNSQAEIARRGEQIMPFSLEKTQHQFTKTKTGGLQRVVVRYGKDQEQIQLIRQHLLMMSEQFTQGDFSGPEAIHGAKMPGLAQLKAAKPGSIMFDFGEETDGASIQISSKNKQLIKAIHHWFDAQVHDHGHDALDMAHCMHHQ